jgi:hypothetical protein
MHWALRSGNGDIDLDVDSIHVIRDCSRYPDVRDLISKLNRCMFVVDSDPTPQNVATLTLVHKARSIEASKLVESGPRLTVMRPSVQDAKLSAGINRLGILASGKSTLQRDISTSSWHHIGFSTDLSLTCEHLQERPSNLRLSILRVYNLI